MSKVKIKGINEILEEFDYEVVHNAMDTEICEDLNDRIAAPCTEQEFVDAYAEAHKAKYGKDFVIN